MESWAYFYECGTLLNENDSEFESYNMVWNHKYGYYNTDWGVVKRTDKEFQKIQDYLIQFIKNSKNTYAVIEEAGKIYYDDESEWEEDDLCAKYDITTSGRLEDVVWSIANIDGKIIENFLKK